MLFRKSIVLLFAAFVVLMGFTSRAQIYKANNNDSLELGSSWTNGAAPTALDVGLWDANVSLAANCTNTLAAPAGWLGVRILNPIAPVKVTSSSTLSIGGSGIDLNQTGSLQDLWLASPVSTTANQSWSAGSGRVLRIGDVGKNVTVAHNVTINGHVIYPNAIIVNSSGSLNIPSDAIFESTVGLAATSLSVNQATVNQTGGTVRVGRTDGTTGSPKSTISLGASAGTGTYNLTGGSLIDISVAGGGRVDLGTVTGLAGVLNIDGTGSAQLQAAYIANGGNGIINVTNGTLVVTNNFRVGTSGTPPSAGVGTMNIYGGTVTALSSLNVPNGTGVGTLNVSGGNLSVGSSLNLPNSAGTGTLTISGGTVTVANNLSFASTGAGTVNLSGGLLAVNSVARPSTAIATLNLNGGTLKAGQSTTTFIASGIACNVTNGGAVIDTAEFNITIPASLSNGTGGGADGGLTKLGTGRLTLAGTNNYTGSTVVNAGTLAPSNSNSVAASTNIVVASGATLDISGGGTLMVHGAPTLGGTLVMQLSKSGLTLNSDKLSLAGVGTLSYGGTLTVTASGDALVAGDTFDLFDAASFSGAFAVMNLPTLSPGLSWDTSKLNVNGTIKVSAGGLPVVPPTFNSIVLEKGTNVVFGGSGGTSNGAYFVLSSTNVALPLENWTMLGGTNLFDASGHFVFTNAVNPALPAQFFALSLSPLTLSAADSIILQALQNMRDEGFNSYLPAPGGLYINWRYTNSPPVSSNNVNINYDGTPDPDPATRHDRLTDIDYLAALCLYKQLHPLDAQFDAEINRYTTICQSPVHDNFLASPDQRGWVYWVLEDIISEVPSFAGYDNAQADKYYNLYSNHLSQYGQTMPLYYSTPADELNSTYRVDLLIEDACVLIVNGKARNLTNYVAAGENLIAYAQSNAYSSTLKMWTDTMGRLFTDTNRTAVSPPSQQYIYDATVNTSEIAEMIEALCRAEAADPGKGYGSLALATLNKLVPATNSFGLWDTNYGGYYSNLILNGTNIQSATLTASVNTSYKQVGRATVMIQAFLAANKYAGASYSTNTFALINTANLNSYFAAGHGWPFQENNDYSIYLDHVTTPTNYYVPQNWVTSEAISHAVRALLKYQLAVPK